MQNPPFIACLRYHQWTGPRVLIINHQRSNPKLARSLHLQRTFQNRYPGLIFRPTRLTLSCRSFPLVRQIFCLIKNKHPHHCTLASVVNCKMDPSNPHVQDVDDNYQRPEISPEDKIVSSYLEDHSETYRGLVELQNDVIEPRSLRHLATLY